MSYIVRNLMTRPTHLSTYWVNIRGLFNPKHIDRVNKHMTNNLLLNSQNKLDLDETFTLASDVCCLKSNPTKTNQTNSESFLQQPKQFGFFTESSDGGCLIKA